ncbi:hypothetical protein R1sor_023310 [Riccia sorocarpa]|uniref:Reverse transcriptase zinc-binding domain-containing protein n=1 Tax=Riccia sorocarpa TaxID=122646 RepID=A0ABD3GPI3_9MARC
MVSSPTQVDALTLSNMKTTLHNLYADDTGVFIRADPQDFRELEAAVRLYEEISGAKLNQAKSTLVPIAMDTTPSWISELGCYVAREGEVIRYLGFPIGWKVKQSQKADYVLGKIQRRLGSWTYRLLFFPGRIVVMRHILKAIPTHLLSCLTFNKKMLERLEMACREFVWRKSDQGQRKLALIAWEDLTATKQEGGLAVTSFELQSKALRLKQLLKVFSHPEEDWVQALQAILRLAASTRRGGTDRRNWTIEELLLSECPKTIPGAQNATGFLQVWNEARQKLKLQTDKVVASGETPSNLYLDIIKSQSLLQANRVAAIRQIINRNKIKTTGEWQDWAWSYRTNRTLPNATRLAVEHGKELDVESTWVTQLNWRWRIGRKEINSWTLTTRTCKHLLTGEIRGCAKLNRKWGVQESQRKWSKRFRKLWKSMLPPRDKAWVWKILQAGLPTLARAKKWRPDGDPTCVRCGGETETATHLFWTCDKARNTWRDFSFLAEGLSCLLPNPRNLLAVVDAAFAQNRPARYLPFVAILKSIWRERNTRTYQGRNLNIPIRVSLELAMDMALAQIKGLSTESIKHQRLQEAIETTALTIQRADSLAAPGNSISHPDYPDPDHPEHVTDTQTSSSEDEVQGRSLDEDYPEARGISWRYLQRGCPGRLQTDGNFTEPVVRENEHTHAANEDYGLIRMTIARCRERAATENTHIPQIYQEEANRLSGSAHASAMLPVFRSIDTSMYRARRIRYP